MREGPNGLESSFLPQRETESTGRALPVPGPTRSPYRGLHHSDVVHRREGQNAGSSLGGAVLRVRGVGKTVCEGHRNAKTYSHYGDFGPTALS